MTVMRLLATCTIALTLLLTGDLTVAEDSLFADNDWQRNGLVTPRFEIQGTGGRDNPLRRQLKSPFTGDEIFLRYRLRYQADTVDTPADNNGEFFVLWLDEVEGNTTATHSNGIPNIGLHVADDGNRFMVRYSSGGERFGPLLEGDREFLIVGRLWKSSPGKDQPFDQLDLWVDPKPDVEFTPAASVRSERSIATVRWIGFSTGAKTEIEDRIEVWDIDVARSWRTILRLPPESESKPLEPVPEQRRTVAFRKDVYPILKAHCFDCHAGEDAEEGVRLDILDEVLNKTAPRNATESRLFQLVSQGEMPPGDETLKPEELAVLRAWINEGLDWDEELLPTPVPQTDHWAFQPIRRPEIPVVQNSQWVRTPVDAFITRKHEQLGIQPAREANPSVLRRRLSLDLLGLPPGPTSADSTESVPSTADVDRLLERPEYGQRWARHWLDLARWAESNGHQHNRERPYAWRYRDWVIDAFNKDMPYDDFLRAQIAGDELQPFDPNHLIATGFLAAARYSGNELDKDIQRNDILVDIVNTTTNAFLGLTVECAQCHTHKFDPITIRDYYRFQAFFAQGQPANVVLGQDDSQARELIDEHWKIFDDVHDRMVSVKRKQGVPEPIYVIPKSVVNGMKPEEKARFKELEQQIAQLKQSWSYYSPVTAGTEVPVAPHDMRWPLPRDKSSLEQIRTTLLIRGDVGSRGPEVQPGWPTVFGVGPTPPRLEHLEKPRTALADWMTDPGNPLTARVWVNRIWQWHFGVGLVETSGDFGTQGTPPTHPELLDFLAAELMDNGWSTNHIHRLILDSATYRQSSEFSATNAQIDPENHSLWRWKPRRLEAEAIRDSILAVAGQLDARAGGPSSEVNVNRRSIYLKQRRDHFPHQQMLFDSAAGLVSCSRRRVSTTALQPLWLLNSRFMQQAAQGFAQRAGSIDEAARLAWGRTLESDEREALQDLVDEFGLESACLTLFNSSEFVYLP